MIPLDYGARCDEHVQRVFLPRCKLCDLLNREWRALGIQQATPDERKTP